jgi:cytochrome P450
MAAYQCNSSISHFSNSSLSLLHLLCLFLEQMDIVKKRERKEDKLTWVEIQKMKYTWRVAQELMRTIPLVFGGFRKAMKDTSYGGYATPKGWQVRSRFYFINLIV